MITVLFNDRMSGNGILKSPLLQRKRQGLSVRFDVIDDSILKILSKDDDNAGYVNVLRRFASGDIQDDLLVAWLTDLRENISIIGKECEGLLVALLRQDWPRKPKTLVDAYESFIVTLLSAHTIYLRLVLRSIVNHFVPKPFHVFYGADTSSVTSAISDADLEVFDNVHRVIKAITEIVPLTPATLIPLLAENFPYMKRDGKTQAYYVHHLLRVVEYLPTYQKGLFEIIVDRMTKLDVYCPKEEIQNAEEQLEEQQDLIKDMEICNTSDAAEAAYDADGEAVGSPVPDRMAHELANVLDVLMDVMLNFTKRKCHKDGKLDWEATKKLYRDLLSVFDKLILPTHATCHVQFLLFHVCSLHESIATGFFDYLWKRVIDPNTPSILRQAAVSYIGSFVARATFVPTTMMMNGLSVICNFLHRYIDAQDGSERSYPDPTIHGPFISTCQAVFYVFAFRHKEVIEMSDGISFFKSLNLTRIVSCRLNPLKFCLPIVVTNFATVARNYQLCYCYTIIERNNRLTLPVVSNHKQVTDFIKNSLDSFFPFDPYLLVRSSKHIRPIYREYQRMVDEETDSDTEPENDELLEEEEMSCKLGMNPSPLDLAEFLDVYGTSPGFKQSTKMTSPCGSF